MTHTSNEYVAQQNKMAKNKNKSNTIHTCVEYIFVNLHFCKKKNRMQTYKWRHIALLSSQFKQIEEKKNALECVFLPIEQNYQNKKAPKEEWNVKK